MPSPICILGSRSHAPLGSPVSAGFLTREEGGWLPRGSERLRGDQTGIENKTLKPYQVREVLCDMKIYLSFLLGMVCNIPDGGIGDFGMALVSPRWIIGWTREKK